jgi:phosphoribosylaminoimidazole-succinocarboxamide synthase
MYEVDQDTLLLVATDRVSAFDRVFPNGIPDKGEILTQISNVWFDKIDFPNHIIETDYLNFPSPLNGYAELKDRAVLVIKAKRIDIECVVRGYIIGSGWKEYQQNGKVCGITLPPGLQLAEKLPEPIFTPAFKNDNGHDENISFEEMVEITGRETAEFLRDTSIAIYKKGAEILEQKGVILADTKMEFGKDGDQIILIDELLTPDSSRFWPKDQYEVGVSPVSYDKQFVRDFCASIGWSGEEPAPELPEDIIRKTLEKYLEIYQIIKSI